jgi:medium-chain acyl-[acyl-carrier-protein] hydrolase
MTPASSGGGSSGGPRVKTWFPHWRPKPEARLRLFCFPFAGGSASVLQRWAGLGPSVEVLAVQYPGRETRFNEPPCRRIPTLVESLGPVVRELLDRPFAFFGYSLGTLVCLELAHWLQGVGAPAPLELMLAAGSPPHRERAKRIYTLPDADFIAELRDYGGTPPQVLAHRELMELFLPVLRADFEMADEYRRPPEPRLAMPITVWGGAEDTRPLPRLLAEWRDFTSGDFGLQILPGGHFFLFAHDKLREGVEQRCHALLGSGPPAMQHDG